MQSSVISILPPSQKGNLELCTPFQYFTTFIKFTFITNFSCAIFAVWILTEHCYNDMKTTFYIVMCKNEDLRNDPLKDFTCLQVGKQAKVLGALDKTKCQ